MASQPIHYEHREDALSSVQGELLEALLQPDEDFYPWNPAEPEAEAYFAELERELLLSDWSDWSEEEETKNASQTLFNQLNQCWTSPLSSAADTLNVSLSQRFSAFVPQACLEAIANKAQHVFLTNLSLADQLVQCVRPLLTNWAEEDLLVLARPWAYAMRGTSEPTADVTPSLVRPSEWTELSQIEQVRLSLAVAHSALLELRNSTNES